MPQGRPEGPLSRRTSNPHSNQVRKNAAEEVLLADQVEHGSEGFKRACKQIDRLKTVKWCVPAAHQFLLAVTLNYRYTL